MKEKIDLDVFLSRLMSTLNKRFKEIEANIERLKAEINGIRQVQGKGALKRLESKIDSLESSLNSIKSKSQIDKSILEELESEERERRV